MKRNFCCCSESIRPGSIISRTCLHRGLKTFFHGRTLRWNQHDHVYKVMSSLQVWVQIWIYTNIHALSYINRWRGPAKSSLPSEIGEKILTLTQSMKWKLALNSVVAKLKLIDTTRTDYKQKKVTGTHRWLHPRSTDREGTDLRMLSVLKTKRTWRVP